MDRDLAGQAWRVPVALCAPLERPGAPGSQPGTVRHRLAVGAAAFGVAMAVSACGSAAPSKGASSRNVACRQVAAVLSDGPDPGADPVGYAQAQILPLRQLRVSREPMHRAIENLASAYQRFSATAGSRASRASVRDAVHELDAICPGSAQ